jgi:hypothetical protein
MDQLNPEANTGKIESMYDFSQLSCHQKIVKNLSICQAKDAQMQNNERSRKPK